jgi:hypothetical protein
VVDCIEPRVADFWAAVRGYAVTEAFFPLVLPSLINWLVPALILVVGGARSTDADA